MHGRGAAHTPVALAASLRLAVSRMADAAADVEHALGALRRRGAGTDATPAAADAYALAVALSHEVEVAEAELGVARRALRRAAGLDASDASDNGPRGAGADVRALLEEYTRLVLDAARRG